MWGCPFNSINFEGAGIFCSQPQYNESHVTTTSANGNTQEHTTKAPKDQSPHAPPATLKACTQPIVFNIVFYPHSTFSPFPTGKSRTYDTSTTGQSPVSSQPDQNKQLSTRLLNTSSSWLKFRKLFNSYRIATSASSLRQSKINTNCSKDTIPDITEHYARMKLHSPGINTERTPAFD